MASLEEQAEARRSRILASKDGRMSRIVTGQPIEKTAVNTPNPTAASSTVTKRAVTASAVQQKSSSSTDGDYSVGGSESDVSSIAAVSDSIFRQHAPPHSPVSIPKKLAVPLPASRPWPLRLGTVMLSFAAFAVLAYYFRNPDCWSTYVFGIPLAFLCSPPPAKVFWAFYGIVGVVVLGHLYRAKRASSSSALSPLSLVNLTLAAVRAIATVYVLVIILARLYTAHGRALLPTSFIGREGSSEADFLNQFMGILTRGAPSHGIDAKDPENPILGIDEIIAKLTKGLADLTKQAGDESGNNPLDNDFVGENNEREANNERLFNDDVPLEDKVDL